MILIHVQNIDDIMAEICFVRIFDGLVSYNQTKR